MTYSLSVFKLAIKKNLAKISIEAFIKTGSIGMAQKSQLWCTDSINGLTLSCRLFFLFFFFPDLVS